LLEGFLFCKNYFIEKEGFLENVIEDYTYLNRLAKKKNLVFLFYF